MCQAARCGCGVAVMMPGLILVSQGGVTFTAMEQNKVNPWGEQSNCERQLQNENPSIYLRYGLIEMIEI